MDIILKLSRNDIVKKMFCQFEEPAPNGIWEIQVPWKIVSPEKTIERNAEFLQNGSWLPVGKWICEIPISDLIEFDDFFADSLLGLFNFREARTDARIDAEKEGLDADATEQKVKDYENNARTYADEAIRAMFVDTIIVGEKEFRIEWVN